MNEHLQTCSIEAPTPPASLPVGCWNLVQHIHAETMLAWGSGTKYFLIQSWLSLACPPTLIRRDMVKVLFRHQSISKGLQLVQGCTSCPAQLFSLQRGRFAGDLDAAGDAGDGTATNCWKACWKRRVKRWKHVKACHKDNMLHMLP